jgi:hypothetical protein
MSGFNGEVRLSHNDEEATIGQKQLSLWHLCCCDDGSSHSRHHPCGFHIYFYLDATSERRRFVTNFFKIMVCREMGIE